MKMYEKPKANVIEVSKEDIIQTSLGEGFFEVEAPGDIEFHSLSVDDIKSDSLFRN